MTTIKPLAPSTSTDSDNGPRRVQTAIVGGGQAGLATAHWLTEAGRGCLVLEARKRIGDQWRERYDSLRLFTAARVDGLPGMPFPGPKNAFPSGRELADYLEAYAASLGSIVQTGTQVTGITAAASGGFILATASAGQRGEIFAENVVMASGSDAAPKIPAAAAEFDPGIRQLHSSGYRNPSQLLPGPVLVVGASQSGADLALEAAQAGHETWLSGRHHGEIPINERLAGPLFWFAANHVLTLKTPLGRRLRPALRRGGSPLIRTKRSDLDSAGVHRTAARTVAASDGKPLLDDGTILDVTNVLWCTGYRPDYSFLRPAIIGTDGFPAETEGTAEGVAGLFYVGLIFERGFYSHLVGGVGRDARLIADRIAARSQLPN